MKQKQVLDRNLQLFKSYLADNKTLEDLSIEYGITKERVRQLILKTKEKIIYTKLINSHEIIGEVYVDLRDIKPNSYRWLNAINAYEKALSIDIQPKFYTKDDRKLSELTVSEFLAILHLNQ